MGNELKNFIFLNKNAVGTQMNHLDETFFQVPAKFWVRHK